MNVSLVRRSAGQWLRIVAEARDAEAPPVVGWKLPHLGCGGELNARGAELLRESAARHGDVFSLYLGGQLITVCQEPSFMRAFYNPDDEALGPIEAGDLDSLKGGYTASQSSDGPEAEGLQRVLAGYRDTLPAIMRRALACRMPLSAWGRLNLTATLRRWMKTLSRELLGGRGYAPHEGLDTATRSMAAVTALCLTHIGQDVALMGRLRQELEWLGDAKLAKAPLLNACLDEALRLYGPLLHFRKTRKPLLLENHTVPAERVVAFSPFLMHRRRDLYTKPDAFDPDRYLRGPQLVPFDGGPQQRADERFVRALALACLDYLLRDREVLVSSDDNRGTIRWSLAGAAPSQPRWLYHGPTLHQALAPSAAAERPRPAARQQLARTTKPTSLSDEGRRVVPMIPSKPRSGATLKRSPSKRGEPRKRSRPRWHSEPVHHGERRWHWAQPNHANTTAVTDMAIRLRRKRVLTGLFGRPTGGEHLLN